MRLSKEKAAENRAKVIDAALGLFQRRGFSGVGVAELMGAAGLTPVSYTHLTLPTN